MTKSVPDKSKRLRSLPKRDLHKMKSESAAMNLKNRVHEPRVILDDIEEIPDFVEEEFSVAKRKQQILIED